MTPLILTPEAGGERLDAFLARSVEGLTRSAAQRLLEEGAVTSGGRPLKKSEKTAPGQVVEVVLPEPEPVDVLPQNIPLDVVYEDSDVIVVNKPVGMVVHPAPGHPDGTLVNALLYHCGNTLSGINGELRPGIVHRIDRDTSGLIIAAKNDRAHLALAEQLQDHSLARVYEAVAVGNFAGICLMVQKVVDEKDEDRRKMMLKVSYNVRMLVQAVWVVIAIASPWFQPFASVLPLFFPRITIYYLQITGKYQPAKPRPQPEVSVDDPDGEAQPADDPGVKGGET